MNNTSFIPYQRLELKNMSAEKIISIIRVAAKNYDDTSLILTPRIDQSGQAYYWTGLRYGECTELDFKLMLNQKAFAEMGGRCRIRQTSAFSFEPSYLWNDADNCRS